MYFDQVRKNGSENNYSDFVLIHFIFIQIGELSNIFFVT